MSILKTPKILIYKYEIFGSNAISILRKGRRMAISHNIPQDVMNSISKEIVEQKKRLEYNKNDPYR